MWSQNILLVIVTTLLSFSHGFLTCLQDSDCRGLEGGLCINEECTCPTGLQAIFGATVCGEPAPYYMSSCVEVHQCSRLITGYDCGGVSDAERGNCYCRAGHHFFYGRCWHSIGYGEPCDRDEECMGILRDPFSLRCDGTCVCAEGYYRRQSGECRKSSLAVGEGCVLDEDCQFAGGACDQSTFTCYNLNDGNTLQASNIQNENIAVSKDATLIIANVSVSATTMRQHGVICSFTNPCPDPFECSNFGTCICPRGYYYEGNICMAELGSPSSAEQCAEGLFKEVRDGICTCQTNFYYAENMRDCVKATLWITHSCVADDNCHTFGAAAVCGAPQEPWGLRSCECVPELAIWDPDRAMCRLIARIGDPCTENADCVAGNMTIVCANDATGQGYCACPQGYLAVDGLCLTSGLVIGESCQATQECTGTSNTVCDSDQRCSCSENYREVNGICAPALGGACTLDSNCVADNSVCQDSVCRCGDTFLEYDGDCWPVVPGFNASCSVTAQCVHSMGEASSCEDDFCVCANGYHYRDNSCWPVIGLFDTCSRTSECYLAGISDRVVCRNSLCQCDFDYPYSEELHTCGSSATAIFGNIFVLITALIYTLTS